MRQQEARIVTYVRDHEGVSPADLAGVLGVSTRTLRTHVRRINDQLVDVAVIELRPRAGYRLIVRDDEALEAALAVPTGLDLAGSTPSERASHLMVDLLLRPGWVTLDELAHTYYLSRSTVSSDLRLVREELARHDLSLESRPHHGLRVAGPELARRLCLAELVVRTGADQGAVPDSLVAALSGRVPTEVVARCLDEALAETGFSVNPMATQNLVVHLSIAVMRTQDGNTVPVVPATLEELRGSRALEAARAFAERLEASLAVTLPEGEVAYVAMHLSGRETLLFPEAALADETGLVVSDEVWSLVAQMVDRAGRAFGFDFSGDLELRMNLARHVAPLVVRLRHGMHISNPLLAETRTRFPLAWAIALDSSSVLAEALDASISANEVGYLALAFELAIERQRTGRAKKRILVVCASGQGSARMLEHLWRRQFADSVEEVVVADAAHLDLVDLTGIDYAFTTVPLPVVLPIPVCEVRFFLDEADVTRVRKLLGRASGATGRFDEGLFWPHLAFATKAEALDELCARVRATGLVDPSFRELVWRREEAMCSSFGNDVAMPHPMEPTSERAFAAVGLLDEPLDWGGGAPVRAIFLVSTSEEPHEEVEGFFSALADLLVDEGAVAHIVADQRWEALLEELESHGLA